MLSFFSAWLIAVVDECSTFLPARSGREWTAVPVCLGKVASIVNMEGDDDGHTYYSHLGSFHDAGEALFE